MSLDPMIWAIKDAPTADAYERCILNALAETADDDGCGAFLSKKTLADRAHCDPDTVKRKLGQMQERGLLGKGDQSAAAYLPANRRPTVYDLMIPYAWYGSKIDRVNEDRERRGRPPLTPADRPAIGAPPERTERSDKGKPNPNRRPRALGPRPTDNTPPDQGEQPGGTLNPPSQDAPRGDSESPPGGIEKDSRGDSQSPKPPVRNQSDEPQPPSGVVARAPANAHAYTREGAHATQPPQATGGQDALFDDGQTKPDTAGQTSPRKGRGRKRRAPWPGVFDPADDLLAWAAKHYPRLDLADETARFNAYWDDPERAQLQRDWPQAWRKWVEKSAADGPRRAPAEHPAQELVERAAPTVDAWCKWWSSQGPVLARSRVALMKLVVDALQAGADITHIQAALKECRELNPAPHRFQDELIRAANPAAPIAAPARRQAPTDAAVAQVDDAVARAIASLPASRDTGHPRALEGGPC